MQVVSSQTPNVQRLLARQMHLCGVLRPMLPASLLSHRLEEFRTHKTQGTRLPKLSATQLQTLCRGMITLPSLIWLTVGCSEVLNSCKLGTPGGAIGDILARLPRLQHLTLQLHVSPQVFLGRDLPLPASLKTLSLRKCVLEVYMGSENEMRSEDEMLEGCHSGLDDIRSRVILGELHLPINEHSEAVAEAVESILSESEHVTFSSYNEKDMET